MNAPQSTGLSPSAATFASMTVGKGASMIGMSTIAGMAATTVQAGIAELFASGFSADTIVPQADSGATDVDAVELQTDLTANTPSLCTSRFRISTLLAGAKTLVATFSGKGLQVPAGDVTNPGLKVGTHLIWDDGANNLRVGVRSHYITLDGILLNPNSGFGSVLLNSGSSAGLVDSATTTEYRAAVVATVTEGGTTTGTITALKAVALNSSSIVIVADQSTPTNCIGVTILGRTGAGAIRYVKSGLVSGALSGATPGAQVYLSTAGAITTTKPTSGRLVLVGLAASATDLWVDVVNRGPVVPLFETTIPGHNGAGPITLSGVKVGDIVTMISRPAAGEDDRSAFEATITVNDQIQQTSAINLSTNTYFLTIWRMS